MLSSSIVPSGQGNSLAQALRWHSQLNSSKMLFGGQVIEHGIGELDADTQSQVTSSSIVPLGQGSSLAQAMITQRHSTSSRNPFRGQLTRPQDLEMLCNASPPQRIESVNKKNTVKKRIAVAEFNLRLIILSNICIILDNVLKTYCSV